MPKLACLYSGRSITFWIAASSVAFCCAAPDAAKTIESSAASAKRAERGQVKNEGPRPARNDRARARRNPNDQWCAGIEPPELICPRGELLKGYVSDGVLAPVFVVEVPPFGLIDGESLRLHGPAEQVAVPALERGPAGIIGERAGRHFVVEAGHLDRLVGLEVKQREIDGASAIVARALCGIGDEDFSVLGSRIPENFGDIPGTVAVVDQQAVAVGF